MDKGWIKLSRNIQDNMLWDDKPFSKGQAWIDLLLSVNHKDRTILIDGVAREIKKGQMWTSQKKLAERWGWSRNKVGRFLELLTEQHMVQVVGTAHGTTLSIEKWAFYQNQRTTLGATDGATHEATDGATDGAQTRMLKNVKESKEGATPDSDEQYPWDEEGWFDT